ncbi:unnamed protein product, partial [Strongylus vulgaris]
MKNDANQTPAIAAVLRTPFYRAAQIVTLSESIAAIICVVYAFAAYRKMFSLHLNIALLLYLLYISCFIHAVVYSISKIYQLYISFFTSNPCHMFLPRTFYIISHNVIVFGNTGVFNTLAAMVIERCVATVLVDTYERRFHALGFVLCSVVLIITSMELGFGYEAVAGEYLMTNSVMHP